MNRYTNEYLLTQAEIIKFIGNVGKQGHGLHRKAIDGHEIDLISWQNQAKKNSDTAEQTVRDSREAYKKEIKLKKFNKKCFAYRNQLVF